MPERTQRRYTLTTPANGDLSSAFLAELNRILKDISTDLAAIQGFDNSTPTFHNDFNMNKRRICRVGQTRDDDDVPAIREQRDKSVWVAPDGLITAKRKLHATQGLRTTKASDPDDAVPLKQAHELAALTPPAWVGNAYAQITSNQNNYPLGSVAIHRLTTDASRTLTGFVAFPNALRIIINAGSNDLVLAHQSGSSSAANRLVNQAAANLTLTSTQAAIYWYDSVATRWRQIN